jgi:hypothetical protein
MKSKEELEDILTAVYKKYYSNDSARHISNRKYVTDLLIIELLCDIRELLLGEGSDSKTIKRNRNSFSKKVETD